MNKPQPLTPKELLDRLKRHRVRRIAQRNDEAAEALFDVAAGERKNFTQTEWNDLLSTLDRENSTLEDWLAING